MLRGRIARRALAVPGSRIAGAIGCSGWFPASGRPVRVGRNLTPPVSAACIESDRIGLFTIMMNRNLKVRIALLAAAAVVGSWTALPAGASNPDGSFSRSAWIARNAPRIRFSSGIVPADTQLPRPDTALRPVAALGAPDDVTPPVRLSSNRLGSDGLSQAETQAEPYLAANTEDPMNLLAGWQESRYATGGARALGYAASTDGGATWLEGLVPGLTRSSGGPWDRASDPWVAFGPGGRAYFCSLLFEEDRPDNGIGVSSSTDGGRTWTEPTLIAQSVDDFNDKQALTVDTSAGSAHLGSVYVAWDANVDADGNGSVEKQVVLVSRSKDGGSSWEPAVRVRKKGANVGCIPRVGPDGTVYLVWTGGSIGGRRAYVFFSRSGDGGLTWSKPRKISEIRAAGIDGFRTGNGLPSFDVDPATGSLVVAWSDARFTGADQVALIGSTDGGATWSEPRRASDGPDDAPVFTVSVAARPGGGVAVSYYSLRNDPVRAYATDYFVQVSVDGGAVFGSARRVTPETFDIRWAAQARGYFLGDYAGLAGTPERFHLLWVDTRQPADGNPDARQPDVFAASTE